MMTRSARPQAATRSLLLLLLRLLWLVSVLVACAAAAFAPLSAPVSRTRRQQRQQQSLALLSAKKGRSKKAKGFGAAPPATTQEKVTSQSSKKDGASTVSQKAEALSSSSSSSSSSPSGGGGGSMNAGQRALAELRRQKAEERDAELRRVRALLAADRQVSEQSSGAGATIPEPVARRMGRRMLPFVGLPLFLGMGAFVGFWYLATYRNAELEPALVAASTIAILVFGLLGITYSVMSASWDPEREGSFWGWDEFARNLGNVREGLGRSRENAVLRDKMKGLGDGELRTALADLERREAAAEKKQQQQQQSLSSKLEDELES